MGATYVHLVDLVSAIASHRFAYVQEWNSEFLSLFPHRFDYIHAPLPQPGERPNWRTESRHPLSDRILAQGGSLFGVRFGPNTRYALIDLDITSPYHPQQDAFALGKLLSSLEPLGLTQSLICTSSHNGGLHLYFPFNKPQRSWKLASALAALLTANGFKLRPGQLEVFPNTRAFVQGGSPSLFNAHRLPLQEPGSQLLNGDLEPIWSSQEHFVQLWQRCTDRNHITSTKVQAILRRYHRKRYLVSEKADKFLNDLNAEIEPGWTGKGQTNRLLGRITMRCFVFHHVIAGGTPLSGQTLIHEIVATAKALPGYRVWCRHQHELIKRATDWAKCIENSHYFPYGSQRGKYKAKEPVHHGKNNDDNRATVSLSIAGKEQRSWNEKRAIATKSKIADTVQKLKVTGELPRTITARFQVLVQYGIGGSSLYRYKDLWHPRFEKITQNSKNEGTNSDIKIDSQQRQQPNSLERSTDWKNPTSLLSENARNSSRTKQFTNLVDTTRAYVDSNSDSEFTFTLAAENLASKLQLNTQASHVAPEAPAWRLIDCLSSGSTLSVSEAFDRLSEHPELLLRPEVAQAFEQAFEQNCEMVQRNQLFHSSQLDFLTWRWNLFRTFLSLIGKLARALTTDSG